MYVHVAEKDDQQEEQTQKKLAYLRARSNHFAGRLANKNYLKMCTLARFDLARGQN